MWERGVTISGFALRPGSRYVLAAGVLWGTTGTAQALAPEAAQPVVVGALRLTIAGAALLALALLRGDLRGSGPWPLIPTAVAAVSMASYQPLFFSAVKTTGVALGTVVGIGSSPILAGILAWILDGARPTGRWMIATALAIAGGALLLTVGTAVDVNAAGIALAIGAGGAYAVYVAASKRLLDHHSPNAVIAVVFASGGLLLVPILVANDLSWVGTSQGAFVALHLGLLATAVAYLLFVRGLRALRAEQAVTLSLAEPLTAALLGTLVLGERPGMQAAVGGLLILIGLAVLSVRDPSENG
jgi:DME family drug/metabolite transporter